MRLSGGRGSRAAAAAAAARAKALGCGRAWQTGAMAQEPSRLQQGQKDEPWKMKPERLWGRRPPWAPWPRARENVFPLRLAEPAGGVSHLTTPAPPRLSAGLSLPP